MKTTIFTQTASGDRTNIMSTFPLWDKEMFLEHVKSGKGYGRYRYGHIGGYVHLLKDMSLEEFDQLFTVDDFTKEEITELFRKEVSLKYGEHGEKAKIKPLSKKELERGCVYEDFSGNNWLYFGEVEQTIDSTYLKTYRSEKKPIEVKNGIGFIWWYKNIENTIKATDVYVLKSPKKLMKKVEGIKIELESEYIHESGVQRYAQESRTVLKLL